MQAFDLNKKAWFPFDSDWDTTNEAFVLFEEVKKYGLNTSDVYGGLTALMMAMNKDRMGWFNSQKIVTIIRDVNPNIDNENAKRFFQEMVKCGVLCVGKQEINYSGTKREIPVYSSPCVQQVKKKTSKGDKARKENAQFAGKYPDWADTPEKREFVYKQRKQKAEEKKKQRLQKYAEESPQERHRPDSEVPF